MVITAIKYKEYQQRPKCLLYAIKIRQISLRSLMNISKYDVLKDCGEDTKMNIAPYCLLVYDLYKCNKSQKTTFI